MTNDQRPTNTKRYFKFEKLAIWENSVTLSKKVYKLLDQFPKHEMYALSDQLRRASSSVSLNIAEGAGYHSDKMFMKYLNQAKGSLYETIAALKLSNEIGYIKDYQVQEISVEAHKLHSQINSLISYLKVS